MAFVDLESVKLFLNKETLTPAETALIERLLFLIEGDISGYVGYDIFTDPGADSAILEYVCLILLVKLYRRISSEAVGLKSMSFQNLSIDYDLSDDLSPFLVGILDRLRQGSLCG